MKARWRQRESETCSTLKPCDGRTRVKTAEAAQMSPPAVACAHGKSPDLTIWVTPHQEGKTEERGGEGGPGRQKTCGVVIFFHTFAAPSLGSLRGRGGEHLGVLFLSFCLLPGVVQFLVSSSLLLSTSCSSLLPPQLSCSTPLWLETSKPATFVTVRSLLPQVKPKDILVQPRA